VARKKGRRSEKGPAATGAQGETRTVVDSQVSEAIRQMRRYGSAFTLIAASEAAARYGVPERELIRLAEAGELWSDTVAGALVLHESQVGSRFGRFE
jgi:DNA invertase Pin-like site-specific DNA recombinase